MNLSALFLFGSRARGDHSAGSDIDLLAVNDVSEPTVSGNTTASLFQYSHKWLLAKADQGDLFVWHLVSEAKPVFDPSDVLGELRSRFRFSESYEQQVSKASDVGWMIVSAGLKLDPKLANRWLAWSVRTVSIAHAARAKTPAFSAHALSHTLNCPDITRLVEQKDQPNLSTPLLAKLSDFLITFGTPDISNDLVTEEDYAVHFRKSENDVGLKILGFETRVSGYE